MKPIYLFADSSLLFWKEGDSLFLDSVRRRIDGESPKAAYIGASNGDNPDFYSIFCAATECVGITARQMISSHVTAEERNFLQEADLILLAGGDVRKGWDVFVKTGLKELIVRKYYEGAVLLGVSAGAVQLGLCGWPEGGFSAEGLVNTFGLVPAVVGAHEEKDDWESLKLAVRFRGEGARGIGIPYGGGVIYHADNSFEPVRRPLYEFSTAGEKLSCNLVLPNPDDEPVAAQAAN